MASSLGASENNYANDATNIPLEELLQTEYIPASHIANQVSNAASAVSIVTAQDIKDYGYRTLGEILGSMRGLQVSRDYEYGMLGGRGFSDPGSYAGRIAVLIDGYRADDSFFGQAYLGNDGILDVSLIDRVEYIPGGGSAGYSNGALLGAINIITKKGSDIDGAQVALGYGSHSSRSRRVTFGKRFENGADVLLNASTFKTDDQDFTYTDVFTGTEGTQHKQNGEENKRLFLKASYENLSLLAALIKRDNKNPTYPYSLYWLDEPIRTTDDNQFIRLKYDTDLCRNLKLSSSIWYGSYTYGGNDPTFNGYTQISGYDAKWYGGDLKLIGSWFDNHVISFGSEYRHDYQWNFTNYYIDQLTGESVFPYSIKHNPRKTYSLYGYDDYAITSDLRFNYGFRYEKSNNSIHSISPQAALIWQAVEGTVLKGSVGQTNRQGTPGEIGDSHQLEHARTVELVVEQDLGRETKLMASLYRYRISNRISDPALADIVTRGAEIEFEKIWDNSTRLRSSYAYQDSYEVDTGLNLINAPHHIAKFNLSVPVVDELLRMGLEVQYLGKRPLNTATRDQEAPSHTLANVNLLSHNFIPNCDISLTIKNMMNKSYSDIIAPTYSGDTLYPQDGRTFWLQLEYTFQ